MRTKLVIWDWNGTLLDDTRICFEIANVMRAERNMPLLPSIDVYREMFRFPVIDYYRAMGYAFEKEPYEAVSVEFIDRYTQRFAECPLRRDAVETVSKLRKRGFMQAILSVTGEDKLIAQTSHFGLTKLFDRILGTRDDLAHGKADLAQSFLSETGLTPESVLFVGDTDHDAAVAAAVGCRAALLTGGHQKKEKLSALGVPVLDDVQGIAALL